MFRYQPAQALAMVRDPAFANQKLRNIGGRPVLVSRPNPTPVGRLRGESIRVALAFVAIYLVWGSTYLAIRYAVETIPPLVTAGIRHTIAGGILLKGPLIVMVVGLAIAVLLVVDREWRWLLALRPIAGIVWLAVLVLPWFLAIIGRAGETFFEESVAQDLMSKIFAGQESHGAPPGAYFVLFWFTFWPGATLAALATPAVWAARREAPWSPRGQRAAALRPRTGDRGPARAPRRARCRRARRGRA